MSTDGTADSQPTVLVEAGDRSTDELVRLALTASQLGGRILFYGMQQRAVGDLLRIVRVGGTWEGRVTCGSNDGGDAAAHLELRPLGKKVPMHVPQRKVLTMLRALHD